MRRIVAAFVACVVVATANLSENDDHPTEELNNIDIFVPNDYTDVEPLTTTDIYTKPILVVTPSPDAQNTSLTTFYLHNGFRTMHHYQAFHWLQEFFKHPGLKALIFYPHLTYNVRFLGTSLGSITIQDNMKMSDLISKGNCYKMVPYIFVAPEDLFNQMSFENTVKGGNFKVYNDVIEVHHTQFERTPSVGWPFFRAVPEIEEIPRKIGEIPRKIVEIPRGNIGYAQSATAGTGFVQVGRSEVGSQAYGESAIPKESGIKGFPEAAEGIVAESHSVSRTEVQEGIGAKVARGSLRTGFGRSGSAGAIRSESDYGEIEIDLGQSSQSETYSKEAYPQSDIFLKTEPELNSNIELHSRIGGKVGHGVHADADSGEAVPKSESFTRSDADQLGSRAGVQIGIRDVARHVEIRRNHEEEEKHSQHSDGIKVSDSLKVSPRMILSGRSLIEEKAPMVIPVGALDATETEEVGSFLKEGDGIIFPSGSLLQDGSSARSTSDKIESHAEVHSEVSGSEGGSTLGSLIKTGAGFVGNVASGIVRTVQTGAEIAGNVASSAVKTGSAIVKTGTTIAGNVGTGVVKTGTELVRTGTEIVEGVGSGIVHVGTDIVGKGTELVENVGAGIVHAGTDIVRTGTGVVADVGSGIIKTGTEIVGTVSSDLVEKGNKIVGDVAKIIQSNLNATAQNVRKEFTHHHDEPRNSDSISISRNLETKKLSISLGLATSSLNEGSVALSSSHDVSPPVFASGKSLIDDNINYDKKNDSSSLDI